MKIKPQIYHSALVIYCILIFILSSIPGDNFPKVEFDLSDKIVHAVIYAVMFALFFYSLKYQSKYITLHKYSLEFALLFTALYGATDEIHQYFVPLRSCEFADWAADVIGALIIFAFYKFRVLQMRNIAPVILLLFFAGCSASNNPNVKKDMTVRITGAEAWLDLMPGGGENSNVFRFYINLTTEKKNSNDKFEVNNFKILTDTDTLLGKKIKTEQTEVNQGIVNISIYPSEDEMYVSKSETAPSQAEFSFELLRGDGAKKKITTSKLNINKVY